MKKLLLVLAVVLFSLTTFTSCEKDDDQSLSEFIVGEWVSEPTFMKATPSVHKITITSDHYTLYRMEEGQDMSGDPIMITVLLYDGSYTIDEKDSTIEMDSQGDPIMYDITWLEEENTMTWTKSTIELTHISPAIDWTREN